MASQSACSLPLLRQLEIMDLSRQKLRILGSKEIHAWGGLLSGALYSVFVATTLVIS